MSDDSSNEFRNLFQGLPSKLFELSPGSKKNKRFSVENLKKVESLGILLLNDLALCKGKSEYADSSFRLIPPQKDKSVMCSGYKFENAIDYIIKKNEAKGFSIFTYTGQFDSKHLLLMKNNTQVKLEISSASKHSGGRVTLSVVIWDEKREEPDFANLAAFYSVRNDLECVTQDKCVGIELNLEKYFLKKAESLGQSNVVASKDLDVNLVKHNLKKSLANFDLFSELGYVSKKGFHGCDNHSYEDQSSYVGEKFLSLNEVPLRAKVCSELEHTSLFKALVGTSNQKITRIWKRSRSVSNLYFIEYSSSILHVMAINLTSYKGRKRSTLIIDLFKNKRVNQKLERLLLEMKFKECHMDSCFN